MNEAWCCFTSWSISKPAFTQRLQEVRNRLHLMQKELAEAIGYSDSFISLLESASTKPGYFFFKKRTASAAYKGWFMALERYQPGVFLLSILKYIKKYDG
jgi:transcriptional regulator with XRE-family HTH domain